MYLDSDLPQVSECSRDGGHDGRSSMGCYSLNFQRGQCPIEVEHLRISHAKLEPICGVIGYFSVLSHSTKYEVLTYTSASIRASKEWYVPTNKYVVTTSFTSCLYQISCQVIIGKLRFNRYSFKIMIRAITYRSLTCTCTYKVCDE